MLFHFNAASIVLLILHRKWKRFADYIPFQNICISEIIIGNRFHPIDTCLCDLTCLVYSCKSFDKLFVVLRTFISPSTPKSVTLKKLPDDHEKNRSLVWCYRMSFLPFSDVNKANISSTCSIFWFPRIFSCNLSIRFDRSDRNAPTVKNGKNIPVN